MSEPTSDSWRRIVRRRMFVAGAFLAVWATGRTIQTVEGLLNDPLQTAFVEHDAPQCGFCTSGQLMSAKALTNATPHPTAEQARAAMTGNICRCSGYNHYVDAVVAAPQNEPSIALAGGPRRLGPPYKTSPSIPVLLA